MPVAEGRRHFVFFRVFFSGSLLCFGIISLWGLYGGNGRVFSVDPRAVTKDNNNDGKSVTNCKAGRLGDTSFLGDVRAFRNPLKPTSKRLKLGRLGHVEAGSTVTINV